MGIGSHDLAHEVPHAWGELPKVSTMGKINRGLSGRPSVFDHAYQRESPMVISDGQRHQLLQRLEEAENAPDLESLIASGQIMKRNGGYELLTEEAREALQHRIKSITVNPKTGKALFTFYPPRKATLGGDRLVPPSMTYLLRRHQLPFIANPLPTLSQ